jgi:hypothetical protein
MRSSRDLAQAASGPVRWWSELRNPALRCERVGHDRAGEWRRGYMPGRGGWMGGVAVRVRHEREVCKRCGVETEPWRPVEGQSKTISSLTTSEDNWDKIGAGGWWYEHGRCAPLDTEPQVSPGTNPHPTQESTQ